MKTASTCPNTYQTLVSHPLTRGIFIGAILVFVNIAAWALTWGASRAHPALHPSLLAIGWLAFGFGLRHAVDPDHISAIDNTTRKLMRDGKRPVGVGLFFSLGHSTIVILLCAALALSTAYVQKHLPAWQTLGGQIGTFVSGLFLCLIGAINLVVFWELFRTWKACRANSETAEAEVDDLLAKRGLLARILNPLLRSIHSSWQMYFVGFLFGLGFDTATEVGILAISAKSGQSGIPFWTIMLLPALFTVGMCLIDFLNGILMLGAYGWACIRPARKLTYNLTITLVSILVAFGIGLRELLSLSGVEMTAHGRFRGVLDDNMGFAIVGMFLVGWLLSVIIYRARRGAVAS